MTTRSTVATIRTVQILTTIQPTDRYLPLWHFNLCPVRQYVFRSNSNNSVINSTKHNFVYLTSEHIRYLVSNEGSPVTVCRNNFTFCITELLKCVNLCCAVCHNLCCAVCHNLCCPFCHNLCCAVYHNLCCAVCHIFFTATVSL